MAPGQPGELEDRRVREAGGGGEVLTAGGTGPAGNLNIAVFERGKLLVKGIEHADSDSVEAWLAGPVLGVLLER